MGVQSRADTTSRSKSALNRRQLTCDPNEDKRWRQQMTRSGTIVQTYVKYNSIKLQPHQQNVLGIGNDEDFKNLTSSMRMSFLWSRKQLSSNDSSFSLRSAQLLRQTLLCAIFYLRGKFCRTNNGHIPICQHRLIHLRQKPIRSSTVTSCLHPSFPNVMRCPVQSHT